MSDTTLGTPEQLRDTEYRPPLAKAVPLGIQHVLAMFASNVTPAIIVSLAAGFAFGSADMVYLIQMAMVFAGVATLLQTIGVGPVGARLPVVQGTSFAFIPVMIPVVKGAGLGALFGGVVIGGVFHFLLGTVIGRIRGWLPPLVTGIVVLSIGLALIPVGIKYAAGGVPLIGKPEFGSLQHWGLALVVIVITLGLKFFTRGMVSTAAVLIGLVAGYVVAIVLGMVGFGRVADAAWFAVPDPLRYGFEINAAAVIGMCLMAVVSAIETVGDISGITKGGAGREATDREIAGGTMADGLGSAVAGLFGGLPNTSFSQNVGLVSMTGVMSRYVVTLGAVFLILAGHGPQGRGGDRDHADRGARRRRDRHVRHGGGGRHQHAERRRLEPAQHADPGGLALGRLRSAERAGSAAARAGHHEHPLDLRPAAGGVPGGGSEPLAAGQG